MWSLYAFDNYFKNADHPYDPSEIWDTLKRLGYSKSYFSLNRANEADMRNFAALPKERHRTGLGLAAIYFVIDLLNPDPKEQISYEQVIDVLEPGDTLELTLNVGWQKDLSSTVHDDKALRLIERLLPHARKRGVSMSLYHHFGFWQERIEDCVRIAAHINDPLVGVTFCGYHWYAIDRTNLADKLRRAAPYLKLVNLCGARPRLTSSTAPLPATIETVGEGEFPLTEFIRNLRTIGYTGDVGFQGYLIGGNPSENLHRSIEAFRRAEAAA